MKTCSTCKKKKKVDNFWKQKTSKDGFRGQCKDCMREYNSTWKKENENRYKESKRAWYENNLEKNKEYATIWTKNNPLKTKKIKRDWQKRNKSYVNAQSINRRARIKKAEGTITAKIIKDLYEEQDGLCAYCGIRTFDDYHVDHMKPLVLGGSNLKENLCISCPDCNLSKGGKSMEDWMVYADWIVPPTDNKELSYVRI